MNLAFGADICDQGPREDFLPMKTFLGFIIKMGGGDYRFTVNVAEITPSVTEEYPTEIEYSTDEKVAA